ncbi:MAG: TraR/DksA family transcriptional regulator [Parcubacteria group bacterium Gr01-1014_48]|nr:MAG: TraR/DksA family transcriptional regulator [Parcubacteria group bacterium Greene0416_14]TSC72573.1 MAG: TraR/DksA family transcriptional regulator [Parcubacteria group bacterium Gr01-1014_48]TSC99573.1 MAG: TraR/DksA family transcriptional regulator [Parcubacteria group bacterium Greene1014_15]TSD07222.1 MAG: TraR/DksA family transcriptional regulator [Parcubacteria group bacterium Greene0714_4]
MLVMDTAHFKQKLTEERKKLEGELKSVGHINPHNPADWEATAADLNTLPADKNEVADTIEEFEERSAILKQLEIQYNDVKEALARIESGTFGKCAVCKEDISHERLEALPTAKTCMQHN